MIRDFIIGTVARACIVLAFSEYIFFNEVPGLALAQASTPLLVAVALGEAVLFYLLSGSLLYVLEPLASSWSRALLVGAFVGWSIEAALVPVAYENVPYSYFWTAVSWHAVIDVCFGVLVLRAALSWPLWRLGALLAALGPAWAIWTTWAWDEARLSPAEFGQLAAGVTVLLIIGMALMRPGPVAPPGRRVTGLVIALNLGFWAVWAVFLPVEAAGLAALAALTGWALWRGPRGAAQISLKGAVPPWRYSLLALLGLWAWACYGAISASGLRPDPALMTGGVALIGALCYALALARQIFSKRV